MKSDLRSLNNIRSIKPDRKVNAELLFEREEEVENAVSPQALDKHEEARKYLAEKSNWRRIVYI